MGQIGNKYAVTHGYRKHPQYSRWSGMNRRCCDPNAKHFKDYGGRGITVCPEWSREAGPKAFCDWAEQTFIEGYWLDRKNNDAGYSPENCQWATPAESRANQRRARLYKKGNNLPTGVYSHYGRFQSSVGIAGKFVYLGAFGTPEEAVEAFENAKERLLAGLQPQRVLKTRALPTGVRVSGKRFQAQVTVAGKAVSLGTYNTPEEASAAFESEGRKLQAEARLRNLAKC